MPDPRTRKPRRRGSPPKRLAHKEWPVDAEDVEAMADAALEEEPWDGLARGEDPDVGMAKSVAEARERAARLAAGAPDPRTLAQARRKKAFLMTLASTGNVTIACAAAGWPRSYPYSLRKADKEFAERWEFASETAADLLEAAALARAVDGVQEDVWHKPKEGAPVVIGHRTVYSDRLLEFLLKGQRPAKYNPGVVVKGGDGAKGGVLVLPAAPENIEDFEAAAYRQQAQFREKREGEE